VSESPEQRARRFAKEMMDSMRESNTEYYERTGAPPTITEADYLAGEEELFRVFMKHVNASKKATS
jgi:hypothetical protein